jgi:hypothetical protein
VTQIIISGKEVSLPFFLISSSVARLVKIVVDKKLKCKANDYKTCSKLVPVVKFRGQYDKIFKD